ncbi:MAG: LSM domain-containing protein [Candidatus Bathyarchaeales archaeon]
MRANVSAHDILEKSFGEIVLVRLKNRRRLRGRLEGFDEHLNLVLRDAGYLNDAANVKKLGSIILRGDNIVTVSPPKKHIFDEEYAW